MSSTRDPAPEEGTLSAEEPEGFTQVPDSLLLNPTVSDGAYRLYAVLKHHARHRMAAYPGRKLLARELGVKSVRTVDARLAELKEAGYLVVTHRYHSAGGQTSNHYHLRFYPRPPQGGAESLPPAMTDPRSGHGRPVDPVDPVGSVDSVGTDASGDGAQDSAPGEGSALRAGDAGVCAESVQMPAHQGSRSFPSRDFLNTSPSTPGPAPTGHGPGRGDLSARIDDHQPPAAAAFSGWLDRVIGSLPAELYPQNRSDERGMREIFTAHAGALCDGDVSAVDLLPVPRDLVEALVAVRPMPATVTHPVGLVRARVGELPVSVNRGTAAWPAWCGSCDGQTRLVEGPDALRRCPDCHPRAVAPRSTMEVAR